MTSAGVTDTEHGRHVFKCQPLSTEDPPPVPLAGRQQPSANLNFKCWNEPPWVVCGRPRRVKEAELPGWKPGNVFVQF